MAHSAGETTRLRHTRARERTAGGQLSVIWRWRGGRRQRGHAQSGAQYGAMEMEGRAEAERTCPERRPVRRQRDSRLAELHCWESTLTKLARLSSPAGRRVGRRAGHRAGRRVGRRAGRRTLHAHHRTLDGDAARDTLVDALVRARLAHLMRKAISMHSEMQSGGTR